MAFFYAVSLVFILLNLWFVVKRESVVVNILPVALFFVLLAIFSVDRILKIVVFFTPISLPLVEIFPDLSFNMFLPTEPLLFGVLLLFILRLASERKVDLDVLKHPVTIAILIYLLWMLITSLTSSMPLVSFKYLMVRIWFIVGFYFLGIKLFENQKNIENFVWIYIAGLMIIIAYTLVKHASVGLLDRVAAHSSMRPFFNDHTSYGAVIAMFIPFFFFLAFNKTSTPGRRRVAKMVLAVLLVAFVFSYTRAAWLSLILAAGVWGLVKLKIKFRSLTIIFISAVALFFVFQNQIVMHLQKNSVESSSNLLEHFTSMSNITSDASNMERINRWDSALKMFSERPVFGFGPGTYAFKYAPYQLSKNSTIITTNKGDGGDAHSEYLGPLAESGLLGMLSFIVLIGV
ncbi:MAG: O-antigen ligase family protein, partial [Prolixibacteraceae bacterium]|nr:O-antigen ligase family protein [Prolixibacteraceae bacterium]